MGHINAGLEWLVQVFNDIWPLVFSTFVGAWLAFQYIRRHEHRKSLEKRFAQLKSVYFILSSQQHRVHRLQKNALQPYASSARRAEMMPPVQVHEDFPRLDMPRLPAIFEQADVSLMNEIIDAEQRFFDLVDLLKRRSKLIRGTESDAALLKQETDKLYEEAPSLDLLYSDVLQKLDVYMEQQPRGISGETLDYLAWIVCAICGAAVAVFFFSHWAINARAVLDMGLDISLVSALAFAMSLYFSLGLAAIVFIMGMYSSIKKLKSSGVYFLSLIVSLLPLIYLIWSDYNRIT